VGFLLRLYFVVSSHYISPDGTQYVSLGYNLWHHGAYVSNGSQFPDIIQPPLYPALSGIFTLFFTPELAGKVASLFFGLLLIMAVYHFGMYLKLPLPVVLGSAWITALHPALVAVSTQAVTESLYLLLLFYGIAYGWQVFRQPDKVKAAALGCVWLLAFLTRPEGLFFFIVHLILGLALVFRHKLRWMHIVSFVLPFFAGSLLYGAIASGEVGHFTLSPKLSYIRVQARMARFVKSHPPSANLALSKDARDDLFKFALSKDKTQLMVDEIFFHPEKAAQLQRKGDAPGRWSVGRIVQALAAHVFINIRLTLSKLIHGMTFPLIYLLLLLAGLIGWRNKRRDMLVYAVIMAFPVFSFLISHVEERFLYGLILLTVLPMGNGLAKISESPLFTKRAGAGGGLESIKSALLPIVLLLIFTLPGYRDLVQKMQAKTYYHQAGQIIKEEIPARAKIAATKPQAVFFAGKIFTVYPFASLGDLLVYLKHNKVRYLLLEDKDFKIRPDVPQLLAQNKRVRLLKKINVSSHRFYLLFVEEGEL